mgnify:CR=1 FL=1
MFKVLFVCTGNICRSPTAEGYMQKIVNEAGLPARQAIIRAMNRMPEALSVL